MRRISSVSSKCQEQGIRWIVLEEDRYGSGGIFLYLHRDLNEPSIYDFWFETLEQAEKQTRDKWGISETDWEYQSE